MGLLRVVLFQNALVESWTVNKKVADEELFCLISKSKWRIDKGFLYVFIHMLQYAV